MTNVSLFIIKDKWTKQPMKQNTVYNVTLFLKSDWSTGLLNQFFNKSIQQIN